MKKKIQDLQFFAIMFFIMRSSYMTIVNSYNLSVAKENSFYSLFLGLIIGIIPSLIFLYILKNSKHNIIVTIKELLNSQLGIFLNICVLITIMILSITTFNYVNDFTKTIFLDKSPKLYICLILILPIIYSINHNIKTLARFSLFILYISLFFIIISNIGLLHSFKLPITQPNFSSNITSFFKSVFIVFCYCSLPIYICLIIPNKEIYFLKSFNKKYILSYILISITLLLENLLITSNFGYNLSQLYKYPIFNIFRTITLFGFINRILSIFTIVWIIDMIVTVIYCFYYFKIFSKIYFKKFHEIKFKYKYQIFAFIFLLLINNNTITNIIQKKTFIELFSIFLFITLFLIPLFIFIKIKKLRTSS